SISSDADVLRSADKLILPGVGAFGDAVRGLRQRGFDVLVKEAAETGKPILGLCVGLQMLFDEGLEFGRHEGLGLIPGRVVPFPKTDLHIPHVGWNQVEITNGHPLLKGLAGDTYFYFVHSYYVEPAETTDVLGWTHYGIKYASVCGKGNVFGVQFHPEKSQENGLTLLRNFAELRA
ncbi:MAG TPA: imidazole glycerol phosphate synthase subunit HisH, partial [Blastocatellia bacterium]|nr:imidazole glycerol phosphate synthase subunit HisH [Blastocatellia bacterium]